METKPALESNLVEEFVRVAHSDFDRTKELLAQEPALVNATWDWGGGDFETALGAASHMGRRDKCAKVTYLSNRLYMLVHV